MDRLTRHLSWCECEGMIVLLDLAVDRYFRLAPEFEPAFRRFVAGRARDGDVARLLAAGLPATRDHAVQDPACNLPPTSGDVPPATPAPIRTCIAALRAEAATAARLRIMGLGRTLLRRRSRTSVSRTPEQAASLVAGAFARSGLLLGISDRCLVRAIACHALCAAHGCPATLVLGVKATPFQAHAWVQHGQLVLVGDHDQVSAYTPILALA